MKSRIILTLAITLIAAAAQAQVASHDFFPPVAGGARQVAAPESVTTEGSNVKAASAQDAINAAVNQNIANQTKGANPKLGVRRVEFPSGYGYVATGLSVYRTMQNSTATAISKRRAYVMAYMVAKRMLAQTLSGLDSRGRQQLQESFASINLPDSASVNLSSQSNESVDQVVSMMLRGFVLYDVKDDMDSNTVWVSIVTTPKTRGMHARVAPGVLDAANLRDGLDEVLSEIKAGVVAPVGGRIITVPATDEVAYVGFGSSIVQDHANKAIQSKLSYEAQKIASMRAQDSLCGVIIGDDNLWAGGVRESVREEYQEFEQLRADDPLMKKTGLDVRRLDHAKETFVAKQQATEFYRSAREGKLPPGVNTKTWFDPSGRWAYAVSVYIPALTADATKTAEEMRNANIVGQTGQPTFDSSRGFTDTTDPKIPSPKGGEQPGPTGTVTPDKGL